MNANKFRDDTQHLKSAHQVRVEMFMNKMGVHAPNKPVLDLDEKSRLLLAKLVMEEVLEYLEGLGIELVLNTGDRGYVIYFKNLIFSCSHDTNIEEVIDGVCDIKFVITKALSMFGIPDLPFQQLVDYNNLMKFSSDGHRAENGKWVKPANHTPPKIKELLEAIQS